MANFAVAASAETIELATKIMELYAREGEKKEDTLLRILKVAENEAVKGTHPELEGSLNAANATIATLIKQINGIVAGQDAQILELKKRLDEALEEKRNALENAKVQTDVALEMQEEAKASITQATIDCELARNEAQEKIEAIQKDTAMQVEKANMERDQAIRERDDARTIAMEKVENNDLLMRQLNTLEKTIKEYKEQQEINAKTQEKLTKENNELKEEINDLKREAVKAALETELAIEKAAYAKEREMQAQLREADKENAKLSAMIEQLRDNAG